MLKYDEYPSSCPPGDAAGKDGVFYRLCKSERPTEEDFLTHLDLDAPFPDDKLCEAMALSFFSTYEAAERLKSKFRKFRSYTIVPVKLELRYGVGVLTEKTGHLNLWEYRGIDIFQEVFNIAEEEEADGNE